MSFAFSIGLALNKAGEVNDLRWHGAAFRAGVSTGATVVAVNGREYSAGVMANEIARAEHGRDPIRLLLKYQGEYKTVLVD